MNSVSAHDTYNIYLLTYLRRLRKLSVIKLTSIQRGWWDCIADDGIVLRSIPRGCWNCIDVFGHTDLVLIHSHIGQYASVVKLTQAY